ncbi:MerR family transcriptional regulator [Phytomonospora endophytica]|uniref:DNA-binding transcriptional MerR regulator n=1 Tax=Phytomonospora endophytica TaxID=714109 RepID=A0A841FHD9_9ACTN|nr:MerR family transcriptional regulator [Phytomonospora endophytica]MBB6035145.1 DNA-binding transcriptional MerR regulator [Phytomonospora endophytica]GIG64106.1 MerR family transcriptional regulator [Phytomonospora endophytica]
MRDGVTIGRAAAFAGVTIKTVRHYHKHGLVPEPPRDSSGYRRYRSADLLRLVQVRTLAAAGVPLTEVGPLLDVDGDRFTTALADVERRLTERIEELAARRDTLRRLAHGDRALLPERACRLLDRGVELGLTPEEIEAHREGMVLMRALVPDAFEDYLGHAEEVLADTRFMALNRECWAAKDLAPDDPRVEELATAMAECFLANPVLLGFSMDLQARTDTAGYGLLNHHGEDHGPAMARLTSLVEKRLRAAGVTIPYQ